VNLNGTLPLIENTTAPSGVIWKASAAALRNVKVFPLAVTVAVGFIVWMSWGPCSTSLPNPKPKCDPTCHGVEHGEATVLCQELVDSCRVDGHVLDE
jgi:hypothetical protein